MSDQKTLEEYAKVCGAESIDQLHQLANPLKDLKIVHVNSTASGGGVAEILNKFVPMMQGLGIDAKWFVLEGSPDFFDCTKAMHNAIQGSEIVLTSTQLKVYEDVNMQNGERLKDVLECADIVFIHDPQPLPLIQHFPNKKGKWIWRCHIDASNPFGNLWDYLKKFVEQYDATIFSLAEFTHPLSVPIFIIAPSIDPLAEKNIELAENEIDKVYELFGLDRARPIILQVSRFDRFKDPVGVIKAYRLVKKINTDVQLVLAGSGAADDPEGMTIFKEVETVAENDPDIHILLLPNDAHRIINALQRASNIVLQKSIREGFGLTVAEALWKRKPVIGGSTGGIRLQVINGETGFVVQTPEGAAYRIRYLLEHPEEGFQMGANGREYVRDKFLITRQLAEYLTLIYSLQCTDADRIELPV